MTRDQAPRQRRGYHGKQRAGRHTGDRAAEGCARRYEHDRRGGEPRAGEGAEPGEPGDERSDLDLTGGRQRDRALGQAAGDEQGRSPQWRLGRRRAVVEGHAGGARERDQRDPDGARAARGRQREARGGQRRHGHRGRGQPRTQSDRESQDERAETCG